MQFFTNQYQIILFIIKKSYDLADIIVISKKFTIKEDF